MGEIEETWIPHRDQELLNFITSVNISCGFHAGSEKLIRQTIDTALAKNVRIGMHPGFDDKLNFGRKTMAIDGPTLHTLVCRQLDQFLIWAEKAGASVMHIKAHGALYNLLSVDRKLAKVFCRIVQSYGNQWIIYGLPYSQVADAAQKLQQTFWAEGFADRRYLATGTLSPRAHPLASISEPAAAVAQAMQLIFENRVQAIEGDWVVQEIKTICIHGDNPAALEIARLLHEKIIS